MSKGTLFSVALALLSVATFAQNGPAMARCVCPYIYKPVCASDGATYSNQCQFLCAQKDLPKLAVISQGECPEMGDSLLIVEDEPEIELQEAPSCFCTMEYDPVCGSDAKTYGNPCLFNCETAKNPALSLAKTGECSGIKTNTKRLASAKVEPEQEALSKCLCPRLYRPVCASNRITYNNPCEFKCAQQDIPELTQLREGPCLSA